MIDSTPLVTIGVLTYNSSATVVETLDSIKAQTYENIELLISDDASKDDTLYVCQNWLEKNRDRFVRAELITTAVNTGTCGNCQRVLDNAKGQWLRFIAGDDALRPCAITSMVEFVSNDSNISWAFSKSASYLNTFEETNRLLEEDNRRFGDIWKNFFNKPAKEQYLYEIRSVRMTPPTHFVKTEILREIGGFNVKYGCIEDSYMQISLLRRGYKCYLLDDVTMNYRLSPAGVWGNREKLFNLKAMQSALLIKKDLCWNDLPLNWRIYERLRIGICKVFEFFHLNSHEYIVSAFIYKKLMRYIKIIVVRDKYRELK